MSEYCCVLVIFVFLNVSLSLSLYNQNHSLQNNSDNAFQSSSLQSKHLKFTSIQLQLKHFQKHPNLTRKEQICKFQRFSYKTMKIIRNDRKQTCMLFCDNCKGTGVVMETEIKTKTFLDTKSDLHQNSHYDTGIKVKLHNLTSH